MIGIALILAVLGLAVGSFLNVCIDRVPARQSLLRPRSHCPVCKTVLAARDLLPVISYLTLRGRCRSCSAPIPRRVLAVEAGTGLLFLLAWTLFGLSVPFLLAVAAAAVLIAVSVVGFENRKSPRRGSGSSQMERRIRDGVER